MADNFNVLVWNVRGLNARSRRNALRGVCDEAKASIACVQETKMNVITPFNVTEMFGARFASYVYLPSTGLSGEILLACMGPEFTCSAHHVGRFSVTATMNRANHPDQWCFTAVYGP